MDRRLLALPLLLIVSCSSGEAPAAGGTAGATSHDAATGAVVPSSAPAAATVPTGGRGGMSEPANLMGRIPVLEYHGIGGDKNEL